MSQQLVDEIINILENWDNISKDDIKEKLTGLIPDPCPKCKGRYEPIQKYGRELDPSARYDAAETLYFLCPNCDYVHGYTF
jgi:hypothetical protein